MADLSRSVQLSSLSVYGLSATPLLKGMVWALSLSLAATPEIDYSFSSSRYLDVSVPWVYLHTPIYSVHDT